MQRMITFLLLSVPGGSNSPRVSGNIMNIMALMVTAVWGLAFLADIAVPTYTPPPTIHLFPVAAVSALFGINLMGKGGSP